MSMPAPKTLVLVAASLVAADIFGAKLSNALVKPASEEDSTANMMNSAIQYGSPVAIGLAVFLVGSALMKGA